MKRCGYRCVMQESGGRNSGMKYYCNPVNVNYRYQFIRDPETRVLSVNREGADPSMICFGGRYYIFASMTLGVWASDDLVSWENHRLPDSLPLYDYAPDVRVIGGYVYLSASRRSGNCSFYRTKDILNGPYEEIRGSFPFWDPNLFQDDDGRVYFYWGCSNETPIFGVEMDPDTMRPVGERKELVFGNERDHGFERVGEDHSPLPGTEGGTIPRPYIEGAWMDKFEGRYYLQYACPGTEFNIYADGVYVGDHPLGPFVLAENNPYSYHPGGFMPGAGHGSTMRDRFGNLWHASTMRISVNHMFERRVGIWPAGLDADGGLFCNQRYGDWPACMEEGKQDPWKAPEWYLLSYGKKVTASSSSSGHGPEAAVDENVQTWWEAATNDPGEWIRIDLGEEYDVRAVQINFADSHPDIPAPGEFHGEDSSRFIDDRDMVTRWLLEGSADGLHYQVIEDKTGAQTDLPHDLIVREEGLRLRFLRLTVREVPYARKPSISGLRVFGKGDGYAPAPAKAEVTRTDGLSFEAEIRSGENGPGRALGYNILWGSDPEKLYHSYMTFRKKQKIGGLVRGRSYYVRIDSFNENGITEGTAVTVV